MPCVLFPLVSVRPTEHAGMQAEANMAEPACVFILSDEMFSVLMRPTSLQCTDSVLQTPLIHNRTQCADPHSPRRPTCRGAPVRL